MAEPIGIKFGTRADSSGNGYGETKLAPLDTGGALWGFYENQGACCFSKGSTFQKSGEYHDLQSKILKFYNRVIRILLHYFVL